MKFSLRNVLMLPLLLQMVGLTVALTFIALRSSRQAIATVTTQLAEVTSRSVINELDGYIGSVQHVNEHYLDRLKAPVNSQDWGPKDLGQLHRQLILGLQQHEEVSALLLGLSTGELRMVYRLPSPDGSASQIRAGIASPANARQLTLYEVDANGGLGQAIGTQQITDVRDRPWYQKASQKTGQRTGQSQSGWDSPDCTVTANGLGIHAYASFSWRNYPVQGVIATEMSFLKLSAFLQRLQVGPRGEVFIMTRGGELIAQSADGVAPIGPLQRDAARSSWPRPCHAEARRQAADSNSPGVRGAARYLQDSAPRFDTIRSQQQYVAQINGDRRLLQVVPYGNGETLDWLIVTTLSEADFLGDAQAITQQAIALSLLILCGSIALSYGLVSWLVSSLAQLDKAAQDIEYGASLPPPRAAWIKEIARLQQTVAGLVHRLSELLKDSEAQVRQRTVKLQRSEAALKEAQRVARMGGWILDARTSATTLSQELLDICGLQGAVPTTCGEFMAYLPSTDRAVLKQAIQGAIAAGRAYEIEHQFTRPDGVILHVISRGEPVFDDQGQVVELIGTATDISDRKRADLLLQRYVEDLAEWRDRYDAAARASGQVLFEYDLATDKDTWGPNTEAVLGYERDQMPNGIEAYVTLIHPDDRPKFRSLLARDKSVTQPYRIEFRFQKPDGSYMWVKEQGITRYDADGNPIQVIGYIADISARKGAELALMERNEQLNWLANVDALTQVANRRQLQDFLAAEWQYHQQTQHPLTIVMVDIDHFKAFNDRYGHPAGDRCLHQVAQALQSCVSATDLVSRYGGEEFTILLTKTNISGAREMALCLQEAIANLAIPHPQASDTGFLTVSIGVAVFQTLTGLTLESALTEADDALYQAKQTRNTYRLTLIS